MAEDRNGAAPGTHGGARFTDAIRHAMAFDTLDLDAAGLADWDIRLAGRTWILVRAGGTLDLGGTTGARMRIVRQGVTHLLVGGNGYASILSAIEAARGGETILVAPGIYREERAFVIDRPVTLQGVSERGMPVMDSGDVAATVVASFPGAGRANFAITAPGVVFRGLAFLAADRQHPGVPGTGTGAIPQVRLFDGAGRLKRLYPDIQAALDAAGEGDRIAVPEGRHVGDLHVSRAVTLTGMNVGRPGGSSRRGIETTILGRIVMHPGATALVIDGLVILGSFAMERAAAANRRFALRNCVIDGRDGDTAISLARGSASEIVNNLILGGCCEAIGIPCGFDDLSIYGNSIQSAAGAAGIVLGGGAGPDCVRILANTFLDGDYGILIEVDGNLGQRGDVLLLSGNHFGEIGGGVVRSAPVVAAVHADGPVPAALASSLGVSLELNTYHVASPGLGADVVFESPGRSPALRALSGLSNNTRAGHT